MEGLDEEQIESVASFWRGVWEAEATSNQSHPAITTWKVEMVNVQEGREEKGGGVREEEEGRWTELPDRGVAGEQAIKKQANWKAPGPDGVSSYWLKNFGAQR